MKKSYSPEAIVRILQDVQAQLAAGASLREVARQLAVNPGTLCRWQRRAGRAMAQPRSTQRYQAQQRNGEAELCGRMRELALRHPRYGYRRIAALLRRDGWRINRKRVHRLWRKEGLKVQKKQHKRT